MSDRAVIMRFISHRSSLKKDENEKNLDFVSRRGRLHTGDCMCSDKGQTVPWFHTDYITR